MKKNITVEAKEERPTKKIRREVGNLALREKLTIGVDIGDRTSRYCVLDAKGEVVEEGKPGTTKTGRNAWGSETANRASGDRGGNALSLDQSAIIVASTRSDHGKSASGESDLRHQAEERPCGCREVNEAGAL